MASAERRQHHTAFRRRIGAKLAFRDLFRSRTRWTTTVRSSVHAPGGEAADGSCIFSQSGRSIYTQVWRSLLPGYHQLAWDARDAEGDDLANGVYFFRMSATTPSGSTTQQLGRLVKLRKPNRVDETVVP